MARRSSARLRERNLATPKRVSMSQDQFSQVPQSAPSKLRTIQETEDIPGSFPQSPEMARNGDDANQQHSIFTPTRVTPMKPAAAEMHPKQHYQSTAKPREEARHLGFFNVAPHTAPPKQHSQIAALQGTPSKVPNEAVIDSGIPKFEFTFQREHSLELSPAAKRLMYEKREEAARIREQMVANGETKEVIAENLGRKFATPVSKKGRFSDAHAAAFDKLPSIANHGSSFRSKPKTLLVSTPSSRAAVADKGVSLKRNSAKAGFELPPSNSKPTTPSSARRIFTNPDSDNTAKDTAPSTAKRAKIDGGSDGSKHWHQTGTDARSSDTAAVTSKIPVTPNKANTSIPCKLKMTSISQMDAFRASPSKTSALVTQNGSTTLFSRSPTKAAIFTTPKKNDGVKSGASNLLVSPLLTKAPLRSSPVKKLDAEESGPVAINTGTGSPLLSRSPRKISIPNSGPSSHAPEQPAKSLLAQTPAKPLFASKLSDLPDIKTDDHETTIAKPKLLQVSPMKSILKSPRRLYSDDPAKVAAGTHLATPEKNQTPSRGLQLSKSALGAKRVYFTSSTKGAEGARTPTSKLSESRTVHKPILVEYPTLPELEDPISPSPQKRRQTSIPGDFTFNVGTHSIVFGKRDETSPAKPKSPLPTTVRHVSVDSGLFSAMSSTKKRKFEYENDSVASQVIDQEDKENTPTSTKHDDHVERPSKRSKPNLAEPVVAKTARKLNTQSPQKAAVPAVGRRQPTLGVKPKGVRPVPPKETANRRRNGISQSRLAELAQPKRRA